MSVDNGHLFAAMRAQIAARTFLQEAIDALVRPTTTGYLHGLESWSGEARDGEYNVEIALALDPPAGAHEWNYPTVEKLEQLRSWLGCDCIAAVALAPGKVRYIAEWNKGDVETGEVNNP